jgi:hypothetical protein
MTAGLLETIVKAVLALAVIPLAIAFYYDRGSKITGTKFEKWIFKNFFFWVLIGLIAVAAVVEVKAYKPEPGVSDKPLEFFTLPAYKTELDAYSANQQGSNWDSEKQQLMRKFESACYAWKAGDLNETGKALIAIETGQDQIGSLRKIPSFVVSNNLGCVAFKQQRNREFKAFMYFQTAKDRVQNAEPFRGTIDSNITILDQMVNH